MKPALKVRKHILHEALLICVTDYFLTALSLVIVSLRNPIRTIQALLPHLFILAAFGAFVWWNGGVVLGKYLS